MDGLILNMYDPEIRRRHDITLYEQSGIDGVLTDAISVKNHQFYLCGDPADTPSTCLQVVYNSARASIEQVVFNAEMSSMRQGVQWSYKTLKQM